LQSTLTFSRRLHYNSKFYYEKILYSSIYGLSSSYDYTHVSLCSKCVRILNALTFESTLLLPEFCTQMKKWLQTIWEPAKIGVSDEPKTSRRDTQMVNNQDQIIKENLDCKASAKIKEKARKINASTPVETCTERLSPFGGVLALVKFFDLTKFNDILDLKFSAPKRKPKLGHILMMKGLLMLQFIGFNRLWHFTYIRVDALLCGIFRVTKLPVASTFWRYMNSMGINQGKSLLNVMSVLRERVWHICGLLYTRIHVDIDTTVETIFGNQQGGRKGHNTKHRGKKGYRPILAFIEPTREYLIGKLRIGATVSGMEMASFINDIPALLPKCVQEVVIRADAEFLSWDSVEAIQKNGFHFIIGNKGCQPKFDSEGWYRPWKRSDTEYNECVYQPGGWGWPCRFVVMRIPVEKSKSKSSDQKLTQCNLFEDDDYKYRIFCTNIWRKPHEVIAEYDKRADVENLVGESKREGLEAIPSSKFKNNYAFFQIVMLSYNIWRYLKLIAQNTGKVEDADRHDSGMDKVGPAGLKGIKDNTIRIARLKLLFIAAKLVTPGNRDTVKYSIHDTRTPGLIGFLDYLDILRSML